MNRTSLSQQAYDSIKQKIITLALPPGAVIDEATLQKELDLGRTPIREALQRLAQEKLVVIVPRRGMFVSEIGIKDLQQLFEVRLTLECLAARYAAQRGTAHHWQKMAAALAGLPPEGEPADNQILITIDEACHCIMYDAAGNEFLANTLKTMYSLSLRLWYYMLPQIGDMRRAILEHQNILYALQDGDADEAARLIEKHIYAFQEEIQSVMLASPAAV